MKQQILSNLGCGRCGYSVEGLSELKCPECGADLTEVGINQGNKTRRLVLFVLVPIFYTVALLLVAVVGYELSSRFLPEYANANYSFQFEPVSDQYKEVGVHFDAELIIPAGTPSSAGTSFSTHQAGAIPTSSITISGTQSQFKATDIDIFLNLNPASGQTAGSRTAIGIDPDTGVATWVDTGGNRLYSSGPFTEKDLLAAFAINGIDTTRPDVQGEAKSLHAFINDFMQGKQQFNVSGLECWAGGGGINGRVGPPWFAPVYNITWLVIWLVGMILLIRRGRKRA